MIQIKLYRVLIQCFILFSFTTFTYSLWPSFFPINRILGFVIILIVLLLYIKNAKKKEIMVLFLSGGLVLINLLMSSIDRGQSINDAIYWMIVILLLMKIANPYVRDKLIKELFHCKKLIKVVVTLNNIVVIYSSLTPSGYSTAWGGTFFRGFAYSEHSLSCACCISLALTLVSIKDYKNVFIKMAWLIPCSVAILQSGARTYIVSLAVIWYFFYRYCIEKFSAKLLILPIFIIVASYFILNSGFLEKMTTSATNEYSSLNPIEAFTNGRTAFWVIDLHAYFEGNFLNKLVGNGFDYVYYINKTRYGLQIWAHNDFVNVLLCNGIIGIWVYFYSYFCVFRESWRNMKKLDAILLSLFLLIIALINGLFVYQHYLYSFVIMYLLASSFNNKELVYRQEVK